MPTSDAIATQPRSTLYYRHRLPVRLMHWTNVLCLTILFMSGLHIFNAHPSLYWGKSSYSTRPAILEIGAIDVPAAAVPATKTDAADDEEEEEDEPEKRGVLRVFGHQFDTTGFLGISTKADGEIDDNAFPLWLTIPGKYALSTARSWHFFFAWLFVINGIAYVLYALWSRHLQRDLAPTKTELANIGESIVDHIKFKHPEGEAAKRYNVLQKLAYLAVIFVLLPLIILMGMAMSPLLDSVFTGWVDLVGGRQSARTIHFIVAFLLLGFVFIHVFEVIISGLWNHMRSMITGYYRIKTEPTQGDPL